MINYNQLRVFYHAAKKLSFTLAANDLFITQPAVTAQVKSLEEYYGLKLFRKKGRGICLTDEGKALYDHALRVFEYEKEIENAIEDMKQLKTGVLRVGTTKAYARYFMPFLISEFHKNYPHIKINLNEGASSELVQSLLDLKIEAAIIARPLHDSHLCFIPFTREKMVLVMAPGHPLAQKQEVSMKDIAREPIIMKQMGSGTRALVDQLFSKDGYTPNILMETSNTDLIKDLVQRGEGISFLVRPSVDIELGEKTLATVPLTGERVFLEVSIAYLKNQFLSNTAKAFIDILLKLAPRDAPLQDISSLVSKLALQKSK